MAADPLIGKVVAEQFKILERVGEGGLAVVYKAKQLNLDRTVAFKVLTAQAAREEQWVKRFHSSARAVARLNNVNTVRVFDFGESREGHFYIVMELLTGRSLKSELTRSGRIDPPRALKIISLACQSIAEAHRAGIVHRDIKPENFYLSEGKGGEDMLKLTFSSVLKLDDPSSPVTQPGVILGVPHYMAPEQGRGAKAAPAADIYALGIVLYEMLSGEPPFDSKMPTEILIMHIREEPPPISGAPEAATRVMLKALSKDPRARHASAEELFADCQTALAILEGRMAAPTKPQPVVSSAGTPSALPAAPAGDTGAYRPVAAKPAAAPSGIAQLVYRDPQGRDLVVDLPPDGGLLGRAEGSLIRSDEVTVSRRHCRIAKAAGRWFAEDAGSSSGTFVNEARIQRQELHHGDIVRCGALLVRFLDPSPAPVAPPPQMMKTGSENATIMAGDINVLLLPSLLKKAERPIVIEEAATRRRFTIAPGQQLVVGRTAGSDFLIEDITVSKRHARFTYQGGQCTLEDLKSTSGTFVNHQKLSAPVTVNPGDLIRMGRIDLVVVSDG